MSFIRANTSLLKAMEAETHKPVFIDIHLKKVSLFITHLECQSLQQNGPQKHFRCIPPVETLSFEANEGGNEEFRAIIKLTEGTSFSKWDLV